MSGSVSKFWTPENEAQFEVMAAKGYSAGVIQVLLGAPTRNVICGKLARFKGERPNGTTRRMPVGSKYANPLGRKISIVKKLADNRKKPNNNTAAANVAWRAKDAPTKYVEPAPPPECKHISIMELTDKTCRWPMGDPGQPGFSYCGLPPWPPSRYCPYHLDVSTGRRTS